MCLWVIFCYLQLGTSKLSAGSSNVSLSSITNSYSIFHCFRIKWRVPLGLQFSWFFKIFINCCTYSFFGVVVVILLSFEERVSILHSWQDQEHRILNESLLCYWIFYTIQWEGFRHISHTLVFAYLWINCSHWLVSSFRF